jgi:superfamily II DNA/RNA helicase
MPAWQERSIVGQKRPDRQTLLFTTTMPRKIERLVSDILTSPVRITVGITGAANEDVKQVRLSTKQKKALVLQMVRCALNKITV